MWFDSAEKVIPAKLVPDSDRGAGIQWKPLFFLFLTVPLLAWGLSPEIDLDQRARAIADKLRCPVCRGVPISESPSPLAMDMVQTIRQKLQEGQTDEEILSYFENHYGEWILLEPKPKGLHLIIWILPALLLTGGGIFLGFKIFSWTRSS